MSKMIAVVDDLDLDRNRLMKDLDTLLEQQGEEDTFLCEGFSDGASLLKNGGLSGRFSMVFLDIGMAEMDGLETARRLRRAQPECLIVFVTQEAHYALEAYPIHPFDFLVKPYTQVRLHQLMADILQKYASEAEHVEIRIPYGSISLPVSRIISVVASGHGVRVLTTDQKELNAVVSFAEVSAQLAGWTRFLNINRGVLINMDLAVCIRDNSVVMPGNVQYPLRIRNQAELIRQFTQYQIQHRMGGH